MPVTTLNLPPPSSPTWKAIIEGRINENVSSFGLKIMLRRLKSKLDRRNDPQTLEACIEELQTFFRESGDLPSVQHDIKVLFGPTRRP